MIELDPGPEVAELRDAHQAFAAVRFGGAELATRSVSWPIQRRNDRKLRGIGARGLFVSNRLICRDFRPENVALCGN
jgi:hypothetical protein